MPTLTPAQTRELSHELGQAGIAGPAGYTTRERTRELQYPANLAVYEQMRRSDTGVRAALRAVQLPILATRWTLPGPPAPQPLPALAGTIGAAGPLAYTHSAATAVRPEVREFCEAELGLTPDADGRARARPGGVHWEQFLLEALQHLVFGHYPFEQVYAIGAPDTPGLLQVGGPFDGLTQVAHLRKLSPRPPLSLASVDVADDGGLEGIHQYVTDRRTGVTRSVPIPVDRLVMFTNEREGADWTGTSVLRSAYKDWMIYDVLVRLAAIGADRQSMGLPVVTYDEETAGARSAALKIASAARAGEDAGVALPKTMAMQLLGVAGGTVDPLPLMRHFQQQASKSVLAMFLDLGHDAGARSLGDTFVDYFLLGAGAIVRNVEATVSDHVVRDLVRLNFGEAEPWPVVRADPLNAEATPTAAALASLQGAGLLGPVGAELVNEIRRRYDLPALPEGVMYPGVPYSPPGAGGGQLDVPGAPGSPAVAGGPGQQDPTVAQTPLAGTGTLAPQAAIVPGMPASAGLSAAQPGGVLEGHVPGRMMGGWDADLAARVARLSAAVGAFQTAGVTP